MKHLSNFTKDESGAVTVDWVVLTAAIVGIAMAVIGLVSTGVEDASNGIDDTLKTAGGGWSFLNEGTATYSDFLDSFVEGGGVVIFDQPAHAALYDAMSDAAPDGFTYSGAIDDATGTPVYYDNATGANYSVNGEVMTEEAYSAAGNTMTDDIAALSIAAAEGEV